jgi:dGTPase
MARDERALKQFLLARMYRHYKVGRTMSQARRVVRELFALFVAEPELLPPEWSAACGGPASETTARVVSDFIAGMTDRFAIEEHRRLFDLTLSPP